MAVGTGIGLDLDALKNAIKAADKGIEDLLSNSKKAKSSVIQTFLDISSQGVEPFLNKLNQQKEVFDALSKVSLKGASNELKDLVDKAKSAVDETNKLITVYTELDKALAPIQEKRRATMESENDTKEFQKWLELKDKEKQKNDEIERDKFNKSIENIGKQSAAYQKAEDERYQRWLELKDKEKQREQEDADVKWQRQKNTIYQQNAQFAAEELRQKQKNAEEERKIAELLSNERIEQVVKEARRRIENEKLIRTEQKKAHDERQKELEEMFREQERQAKAQAHYDSKSRKENYKAYITSYEGATRTSDRANTLAKEIQAVKNLEAARAKLNKTEADYEAKLRDINNRIAEHNRNIDQATGRAKKLEQQHAKNAEQMMALKNLASGVGRALLGMFSVQAIRGYVNQLIQVRGEFELQQKSLEVLLQNKDKADALWDKTLALAVKSPFRVKDLVTYTKQLAAYRVEADKLYDTNKMLADVSAGLGVDMGRLILAFGQVKAANFLRGTELRQFSEAGVNMLEELSKRYTELEGRMVSVGEVFDRVSKRMVSFSDVEAVFKTITSEGGTFYRMQEQQSETLKGMVMNLKDSIDLMMNEIGMSNESLLKSMVETVKSLVDNWRKFATILQEVGAAFVLLKLPSIVKALGALGTAAYSTAINIQKNGLATATFGKGLARLQIGVEALTTTLFKNPLFWGGAVVAALAVATHQLIRHSKEVQEANKKYDELSQRELGRIKTLESLAQKSQEYNKAIEENAQKLSENKKGTQEYADAEKDLSSARKSNEEILKRLKQEFPELYQSIKENKNGTIELNEAIEEQNRILAINIALNEQAKAGLFHDDLSTNAAEATIALNEERNALSALQASAKNAWTNIISLKEKGRIKKEDFSELEGIIKSLSDAKTLKDANAFVVRLREIMVTKKLPYEIYGGISESFEKLRNSAFEGSKEWSNLQKSLDRLKNSFLSYITVAKEIDPEKWQKTAGKLISSSLEPFGIVDDNLLSRVQDYIETITESGDLTWKIKPKQYTEEDLDGWRKTLWEAIKKVNESLGDDLGQNKVVISLQDMIELDKESIFKNLSEQVKTSAKDIDETIEAGLIPNQIKFTKTQLDAAEASKPLIKSLSELLAILEKNSDGGADETMKKLKSRINLIKEMNKEYEKLNKTFSKAESLAKVQAAYANTAKKLGLDTSTMDFTDEGTIKSLEALLGKPEYAANEYAIELQKALDNFKVELGVEVKQEKDQDLKAQVQELFDQYDLSLELKKLNISKDLAKSLFDVDYLDLDDLNKAVQDKKSKFIGTDMEKEYKDFLDKISDLQRKQREDEAKEFINFLKKNLNEIQLIQDKGAYNISLADKLFGKGKITTEQYVSSIRQIVDDTNKEVARINLEKFKDSATYIKAMGNLAAYSRDELEGMISALQGQVGANAGNMGADEIRAYYEALERLVDQYNKIESPFQKGEINDLIEYLDLQKELNKEKEKEAVLEQRKAEINNRLNLLQAQLKSQQERGDVLGAASTQRQIKSAVGELKEVDGELVSVTSNISVISEKVANLGDGMIKSLVVAQKVVNEIANIANASTKMFDDIKSAADALGADTESGGWAKAGYTMEMVGGVSSELTQGLANFASGNFAGALANVVGMVTKLVSGFAKIHDQNYQDIIETQAKQVERLGKAYEKLELASEEAYSIEQLKKVNEELEKNVELQIQSLKAMIAAENAKKNTDTEQIEAWNEELEALTKQWEELKQSLVEGVGGVADYRSQTREFVDSWVSAFQETGNGLKGLKNNFREFFDNIIAEQAALKVTEKFLSPFYESLNSALEDLELSVGESKDLREEADKIMPQLSDALELIWNQLGGSSGATGDGLSGLQKGIQGITEDTAQIIEAYLNSVRGYVSEQVTYTKKIYNLLYGATTNSGYIKVVM